MDELDRNRQDVGSTQAERGGSVDDPFARWSAARARERDHGLALRERDGALEAAVAPATVESLRRELGGERRRRAAAEASAEKLAGVLAEERDRRLAAEERADAVFAELELATQSSPMPSPQRRRFRRVRRTLRRIRGRR
jgi:hypothetical protein